MLRFTFALLFLASLLASIYEVSVAVTPDGDIVTTQDDGTPPPPRASGKK
jgi:hypothetical protein